MMRSIYLTFYRSFLFYAKNKTIFRSAEGYILVTGLGCTSGLQVRVQGYILVTAPDRIYHNFNMEGGFIEKCYETLFYYTGSNLSCKV